MSEFKVGDWVRHINESKLFIVNEDNIKDVNNIPNNQELWQPEKGEWCFCTWNKENIILAQFNCMDDGYYLCTVLNGIKRRFNMCEPFIHELPSWIKETK